MSNQQQMRQTMFNGNFAAKMRARDAAAESGKYNTYNQYDINTSERS